MAVSGITTATAIAAGAYHTCALLAGGSVECWGYNAYGQLGNGTTTNSSTPVAVSGITTATAITAGVYHTCALLAGGSVDCWGDNADGELGNGTTTNSSTPVAVSGITPPPRSPRALPHLRPPRGRQRRLLGLQRYGQLGNGTTTNSSTPVAVSGITSATAIAAGGFHTCALLTGGSVDCWGYNGYGELGNGTTTQQLDPGGGERDHRPPPRSPRAGIHTCALLQAAASTAGATTIYGELGNGTTTDSSTPVAVSGITTATAIAAGCIHTCALLAGGSVDCWGYNDFGQLGNGTTTQSLITRSR